MESHIRNHELNSRFINFVGLEWGAIRPMDVDLALEFGDRLFVFGEAKYAGSQLPYGQRLALERITDAIHCEERKAICLVVDHEGGDNIPIATCPVREYRWEKRWHKPHAITCRELIDRVLRHLDVCQS